MKITVALPFAVLVVVSSPAYSQELPDTDLRRMILIAPRSDDTPKIDPARLAEIRKDLARKAREEARHKPDFNGHWTAVTEVDSAAPIAREIVVRQKLEEWRIVLDVEWRGGSLPGTTRSFDVGLAGGITGGVAGGVVGGMVGATPSTSYHYSAQWDGDSLVIDQGWSTGSHRSVEHRERWVLESPGRLSVTVTHQVGNDPPVSVSAAYRRHSEVEQRPNSKSRAVYPRCGFDSHLRHHVP